MPPLVFIFVGAVFIGCALGLCLVLVKHDFHPNGAVAIRILLLAVPLLLLYALVFTLAISFLFPSFVCSNGIYGHSFWGERRHLGWKEIVQAKKFRLGNLVYLRLSGQGGKQVIWFPVFQSPAAAFRNEIRKFAPPGHPILVHLN